MTNKIYLEKINEHLKAIVMVLVIAGLLTLWVVDYFSWLAISRLSYLGWLVLCIIGYGIGEHFKVKSSAKFDFYKVSDPVGRQERCKKQDIEERVAIHIDEDGLDPMILFNEEKSGVACILKLMNIDINNQLAKYLTSLDIRSEQLGHPIAGQTLMEMHYQSDNAYYRLSEFDEQQDIEFALPIQATVLSELLNDAIRRLLVAHPDTAVKKIDVNNFQAMVKFYNYVQRLSAPENRCVDYLSYCQGTLKICNSSYVELYDCTLQSTLTSWINQDGLIRTDNVDVELSGNSQLQLMDIELPYPQCRLTNIEIVPLNASEEGVKLYLTLSELKEMQLTGKVSGLSLLMKGSSITIKRDEQFSRALISVDQYFKEKSYPEF